MTVKDCSSTGRALHRHRRGQRFDSRSSINFSDFPFVSAKVALVTAMMSIGHFRVAVCLGFEVSLGAQLLKWK